MIKTERNWTSEQQVFHVKFSAVNQGTQEGVICNTHRWCERTRGCQSGQRRNETREGGGRAKRVKRMFQKGG